MKLQLILLVEWIVCLLRPKESIKWPKGGWLLTTKQHWRTTFPLQKQAPDTWHIDYCDGKKDKNTMIPWFCPPSKCCAHAGAASSSHWVLGVCINNGSDDGDCAHSLHSTRRIRPVFWPVAGPHFPSLARHWDKRWQDTLHWDKRWHDTLLHWDNRWQGLLQHTLYSTRDYVSFMSCTVIYWLLVQQFKFWNIVKTLLKWCCR